MKKKIYFITGNAHKFEEISNIFKKRLPQYELQQMKEDLLEIQAWSLEEVAEFKLKNISATPDAEYFIEDAGFFVDEYKGFPGVYSAYTFKSIGYEGILKLMNENKQRDAHFESVISYMDTNKKIHTFVGKVNGKVSNEARGNNGFGFDPIFLPEQFPNTTFAELTMEQKNSISHRSRSLVMLIEFLQNRAD